jgi:tetratricopeptide (TPR) repeat protein
MTASEGATRADALFQRAAALHKQGDALQADSLCDEVLQADYRHFNAFHLRGLIALERGDTHRAIQLIARALAINPSQPLAYANIGNALLKANEARRALECFQHALTLRPGLLVAQHGLGNALRALNRLDEALASYDLVLKSHPGNAAVLNDRGCVLTTLRRLDEALASFERAFESDARFVVALQNLAAVLLEAGRPLASLEVADRLRTYAPEDAGSFYARGKAFSALERFDDALESHERALRIDPRHIGALIDRGNIWQRRLRPDLALESYDRAIDLRADCAEAHANRGAVLQELGRLPEARISYDRALALNPDFAEAHCNRGALLAQQNEPQAALASLDRALAASPNFAIARFRRAQTLLSMGDFAAGWPEYEWRGRDNEHARRRFMRPQWLGRESLAGKCILLHAEQGLGDTIQFSRYVPLVAELGASIILEVPKALKRLVERLPGVVDCMAPGDTLPSFDYHSPLMSLPLAFGTRLESIPARIPYLASAPERVREMKITLGESTLPRVGLVWAGGSRPHQPELRAVNERRNVPLDQIMSLLSPGIEFHSLQKGDPAESELAALRESGGAARHIAVHANELTDLADTAALIEQLDLVISVDTAMAHLAGALGKPVWLLNRFDSCWRWLIDRTDSPWYPTLRLYRQTRPGDWGQVLERVRRDLADLGQGFKRATG